MRAFSLLVLMIILGLVCVAVVWIVDGNKSSGEMVETVTETELSLATNTILVYKKTKQEQLAGEWACIYVVVLPLKEMKIRLNNTVTSSSLKDVMQEEQSVAIILG